MPFLATTAHPQTSSPAEAADTDSSWYNAFGSTGRAPNAPPAATEGLYPDALETLTLADIPGPVARAVAAAGEATLPTLLGLQHAEVERLTRDNERLMDRIETLLQIQEREQVLRQQLQNQIERINEQLKHSAAAANLEVVRSEARAGMTEELKPVLMAILDALERFARRPSAKSMPSIAPSVSEPERAHNPYDFEDFGKLPLILTRPLDELMSEAEHPEAGGGSPNRSSRKAPFRSKRRRASQSRPQEPTGVPAAFAWTTVISS